METIINNLIKDPYNYSKNMSIDELEKVISYTADKFFNNESVISDAIYDIMIDFLKNKDPKNKILKKIGAKVKSKNKAKLDYYLGSMNKIKPPSNQLEKWLNIYKPPYILTDKLDGVSGLLTYKTNGEIKLYTRGTAKEGIDITSLLKYITKIPSFDKMKKFVKDNKLISTNSNNIIAFRGELIVSKKIFENNWKDTKSNARNTVSGLVNSKTIDPYLAGDTYFVIYEIVDPFINLNKQLDLADQIGFRVVHNKEFTKLDYDTLSSYLKKRKLNSKYVIDGIIVSNTSKHERNINGNPEYAFAFKDTFEDMMATSTITDIEWNISKHGYIIPTVIIEPVIIGGVIISRITANNAKFVVDNKLGKGAIILLIRSGDVIPKIEKIIKPAKNVDLPDGNWDWNDTKVDIISTDLKSKDVIIKSNYFFFSTLDTKGIGEKIINKLYDADMKTIESILSATKEDFIKIDGFKEKSSINLVESIKKSMSCNNKGIDLSILMAASNKLGVGIGKERSKTVIDNYPNIIKEYIKWSEDEFVENLKKIPGWEEKTSRQFAKKFKYFIDFYNNIKKYITIKSNNYNKIINSEYTGKTIVLSGFRDKELENKLISQGAKITNSVTKNTDIVIVSYIDENTSKIKKAKELNIKIITKNNLI